MWFKSGVSFFGVFPSRRSFEDHAEKRGEPCVESQFYTPEEALLS